jgi:protein-disulfide isomerase
MPTRFARAARLLIVLAIVACDRSPEKETGARPDSAAAPAATANAVADPRVAAADSSRIQGSADVPVWIIEISDFQCPYCKVWHDRTYGAIKREYLDTGRARLAYVNFPLGQHQHARLAAEAALCAGTQGRFWEMHDALFDTQDEWSRLPSADSIFLALAQRAGVNAEEQRACLASDVMLPLVQADLERARGAGAQSTPTFIIGDERIEGAAPIEDFRRMIDAALAARAATPAAPPAP